MLIDLSNFNSWPSLLKDAFYAEDAVGIQEFLEGKTLKAWHCTKLHDENHIYEKGLMPLSKEMYRENILSILKLHFTKSEYSSFEKEFERFYLNQGFEFRENMIWFILNKEMAYKRQSGCEDFFFILVER